MYTPNRLYAPTQTLWRSRKPAFADVFLSLLVLVRLSPITAPQLYHHPARPQQIHPPKTTEISNKPPVFTPNQSSTKTNPLPPLPPQHPRPTLRNSTFEIRYSKFLRRPTQQFPAKQGNLNPHAPACPSRLLPSRASHVFRCPGARAMARQIVRLPGRTVRLLFRFCSTCRPHPLFG